ncbi:MAG: hypothetical protein AAFR93_03280 [Pseudomonadota bacterium]
MALSLQTFQPEPQDPKQRGELSGLQVRRIEQRAYERGVRDGAAAAAEAAQQDQSSLAQDLCERLSDALLARAQLEAAVNRETDAMLQALIRALLPKALPEALAQHVSHHIRHALHAAPRVHPVVRCAPDRAEALRSALMPYRDQCSVQEDDSLAPTRAEVQWDTCETWIDLEPVILAVTDALRTRAEPEPSRTTPPRERRAHDQ